MHCLFLWIVMLGVGAYAFVPTLPQVPKKTSQLHLTDDLLSLDVKGARFEFVIWFFGSSGGAGIALRQFPQMYENVQKIRNMAGLGPTEGGDMVGISPLCGYPQDIPKADINKVVNNELSITEIVEKYPIPNNFMSKRGYLTYKAFALGNEGCNPLAVRAVMDTFSQSTDIVAPDLAQNLIDSYKADPSGETFKNALLKSKLQSYAAIGFLLFLLGLALGTSFECFAKGWFPDWPLDNLPVSLWNPGIWTIPDYWI